MLAAFLTTVLFSISAVSGNRTARLLGGTEANFWRLCFAALLLGVWAHGLGGGLAGVALPLFVLSGCIGFGIGDMAFFQMLPRLGSRLSVLLTLCVSPPIAAFLERWWLGTALSAAETVCALAVLAGVVIALAPGESLPGTRRDRMVGVAFGLLAALCQALGAVLSRVAFNLASADGQNVDGITAAYQRIVGGIVVSAVILLIVKRGSLLAPRSPSLADTATLSRAERWRRAWPWVLLNGLAGPALGVSCFQWALKTTKSGVVLPIVAITPLVIIPFSFYFEGERPTRRSLAGGALAVAGAAALAWATSQGR